MLTKGLKQKDIVRVKFLDHFITCSRGRLKNMYLVAYGVVTEIDNKYLRVSTVTENDTWQQENAEIMHIMRVNIVEIDKL